MRKGGAADQKQPVERRVERIARDAPAVNFHRNDVLRFFMHLIFAFAPYLRSSARSAAAPPPRPR